MGKTNRRGSNRGSGEEALVNQRQHEMVGVVFMLAAAVVLLSLASFSPEDPIFAGMGEKATNLIGMVGAYLANALFFSLGIAAFLLVAALGYGAVVAFTRGGVPLSLRRVAGYVTLTVLGTVLCHIVFSGRHLMGHPPGGVVGEYTGALFVSLLSGVGSLVVVSAGMLLGLIEVTGFSPLQVARATGRGIRCAVRSLARAVAWCSARGARGVARSSAWSLHKLREGWHDLWKSLRTRRSKQPPTPKTEPEIEIPARAKPRSARLPDAAGVDPLQDILQPPVSMPPELGRREPLVVTSDPPPLEPEEGDEAEKPARRTFRTINRAHEPEIVIPRPQEKDIPSRDLDGPQLAPSLDLKDYRLPEIDYLEMVEQEQTVIEKDKLREYAKTLEQKLADYGVQGQVTKIMPGPVVTMYEYAPAAGIKVSKIAGLSNDLALALEALSVRIIAPIPGRAVVGIEVANKKRLTVFAKEIIGHGSFRRGKSKLALALGKDIEGSPYVTDLNKMPHLLVAGATGTGKSVALNTMITSILYRATPEDVRFIMVDPKVLELSLYEGIPHLLLPVVTDPRKAQAALHWAVNEMDRRIQILHAAGVRNLDSYNRKVEKQNQAEEEPAKKSKKVFVIDKTGAVTQPPPLTDEDEGSDGEPAGPAGGEPRMNKLPHIVIVIDELADLMMASGRDVETAIARIAQKARAAGIHLIIATQRPSVNVITGLIKANLPARISFRVASKTDSRTILDQNGAETLLGNGDMLFHPPTSSQVLRIHGALITEEEITRVVEHLKAQAQPVYDETILASADENQEADADEEADHDELYDQAVQIVAEMGQASTSMVQRKLRIGYNRAARLIERMEREGIVGPPDGSRPREVLVQNHPS